MKSFDNDKSQTMACTICLDAVHKMRYSLLVCSSQACCEASTFKCTWRGKIVTCLETEHASIFEYRAHNTSTSSPRRKRMTSSQKMYCRELADSHLHYARSVAQIWHPTRARAFEFGVCPPPTLARRVSELLRSRLLGLAEGQNVDTVRAGGFCMLRLISLSAPRVQVAPNKRSEEGIAVSAQLGSNYARQEVEGEPPGGWPVDVERQWCPCCYWFAFGTCVHILYALRITAHVDSNGREVLVSRRKRKRGEVAVLPRTGRPNAIGPALSFE
ncbi:Hypothetical protein PHPALM_16944 [Phytophthora palmivora]|uniref:SWIM-type domain-containing protein n=1 Tax=Phytophthora palmivora TaxID=4796 RepID=A0A2P4XNJ6_9STRA|nr:Hypothetical protein PHPALM_16944 [Phytophthora palmivora]